MKKFLSFVLCAVILFSFALPVTAMGTTSSVQVVHIIEGNTYAVQTATFCASFVDAMKQAKSGDVIEVFDNVTLDSAVEIPDDTVLTIVSGTKRANDTIVGKKYFVYTDEKATTRTLKKNFDGSMFVLGKNSKVTFENITLDGNSKSGSKGGLIYAKNGSQLTVKRKVTLKNSLLGENTFGGAVYVEKNSSASIEDTVFSGNNASLGKDIYAEQKSDVTLAAGVTADFAYPPSDVDINRLNLILSGEIGIVFHTVVSADYLNGTFTLTSRTGQTKNLKIGECPQDEEGRYLATYNVSAIELSEPVTLTVSDNTGKILASKSKSVEDYGKVLLADKSTPEKEKNVILKLLNFGHFAQIVCSDSNGWTVGTSYAETAKYADITTEDTALDNYGYVKTGSDSDITEINAQLGFAYKTQLKLYFVTENKPSVTVDGGEVIAEIYPEKPSQYRIEIEGINALDLAKTHTVVINNNITITLSALSYCKLALSASSDTNCKNAVKALYEFYSATVEYNK